MGFTDYRSLSPREFDGLDRRPRDGVAPGRARLPPRAVASSTAWPGRRSRCRTRTRSRAIGVDPAAAVAVPRHGLDIAPRAPRSGTLLHVQGTDRTWLIDGGARRPATDVCSGARVAELPHSTGILDAIPIAP